MEKKNIKIPKKVKEIVDQLHAKGESVLYLVEKNKIIALLGISDPLKPESKYVVSQLHKMGREVILCTGDNDEAARRVAAQLGIKKFYARAFPDEKAKIIKSLKKQGRKVAFIGDGVNDAPALSVADIGISIRSGADIAIEVADVVINNDLFHLLDAIKISDLALKNVNQNFKVNAISNTIGLVGSSLGWFSPVVSTLINNGTSVFLGFNAVKPFYKDYSKVLYSTKNQSQIF